MHVVVVAGFAFMKSHVVDFVAWRHTHWASSALWNRTALPFNYHAEHRHRIPKLLYRVTNCAEYDALLVSDTAATGLDLS